MRALIVDDSRATRRVVSDILKSLSFEVTEAVNGVDGIAKLDTNGVPDVILVDWNMPEMNGLDFVKNIRKKPETMEVPIVMVTTETEMQRMALALLAGVNEYVMKPFDSGMLRDKLQMLGLGAAS